MPQKKKRLQHSRRKNERKCNLQQTMRVCVAKRKKDSKQIGCQSRRIGHRYQKKQQTTKQYRMHRSSTNLAELDINIKKKKTKTKREKKV